MHRHLFLLAIGLVVGCGGNPGPAAHPSITSFTATPATPIPVGSSSQLTAIFSGGSGLVNPGGLAISSGTPLQVSPTSTTTYTLVVSSGAATQQASATVTVNAARATVGTRGATLQAPDGATLVVPSGALDGDTELSIRSTTDAPPGGVGASSPLYAFEPSGLLFARPVRVILPLPAGVNSGSVYWSRLDGTGFDPIGGIVDAASHTITITTPHFSKAVIGQLSSTRTVTGVGQVTWISATTRQSVPIDFVGQGVEALVADSGGTLVSIPGVPGTGVAAGTFTMPGVPTGEYILHSGSTYLVTDSNTPDLGSLRGGRPGLVPFSQSAVAHISVTGLETWASGSWLEFYATEANDWDFFTDFWASLNPGDTSTSFDFNVADCNGVTGGCSEIGATDHVVLAEVASRTSPTGLAYTAMSRLVEFPPPVTLTSGGSANLSGTMQDVSQNNTLSVDFRGTQWDVVAKEGHPDALSLCLPQHTDCFLGILAQPGLADDGFYGPNADPLIMYVDGTTDIQTGTLHYGSPEGVASGSWGSFFDARVGRGYFPPPLPGSSGLAGRLASFGVWNGTEWTATPARSQAGPVVPPVSMVRNPTVGGQSLFVSQVGIGLTPTFAWTEPEIGPVDFYQIDIVKLVINASHRTVSQPVGSIATRRTSLTLPSGILTAGVPYIFSISAVAATSDATASLIADAPFKSSNDRATAYLSSGVLTP
jgi:hypothetical protein